jgi:hypothetical protein
VTKVFGMPRGVSLGCPHVIRACFYIIWSPEGRRGGGGGKRSEERAMTLVAVVVYEEDREKPRVEDDMIAAVRITRISSCA